jgi:hypothetical protein
MSIEFYVWEFGQSIAMLSTCFEQESSPDIFDNQPEKQKLCSWWNFKSIECRMCLLRDRHSQKVFARCTAEQNTGEQDIHISTPATRLVMTVKTWLSTLSEDKTHRILETKGASKYFFLRRVMYAVKLEYCLGWKLCDLNSLQCILNLCSKTNTCTHVT